MSGHSKWSTIRHKKAATDARRGKLFTRVLREVTVAARLGGSDPEANPRLRQAIQEARSHNVPSDNIDRAVKKGSGDLEGAALEEVIYEGYGPGGVAVLVEGVTDNRNRTTSEVRHLFSKHGGNLGESGCVSWMFQKRGFFLLPADTFDEEGFIELATELDVDDFSVDGDGYQMYTAAASYHAVRQALEEKGLPVQVQELSMVPQNLVPLDDEQIPTVIRLMEALEDQDDVQNVWANFDVDAEILERATSP